MTNNLNFPAQVLSLHKKDIKWRKSCVDWGKDKTFLGNDVVRSSVQHKVINYNLLRGELDMKDMAMVLNPDNLDASFIPDKITHYPIMNSKLNVLRGEEFKRVFDPRVIITNPNAISEIEKSKKKSFFADLEAIVSNEEASEDEVLAATEELSKYYNYEYQDIREIRANSVLNHYSKEYNFALTFNFGIVDAMAVGEESYQCDIVGGEPVMKKINPTKMRVFSSGYSNRIEDADIIVLEDYLSPGQIADEFYDVLTAKEVKRIEEMSSGIGGEDVDELGRIDNRLSLFDSGMPVEDLYNDTDTSDVFISSLFDGPNGVVGGNNMPYDLLGNVRVLKVFWKSKRKIKKVKSYHPETGEIIFTFYPETHIIDKNNGEEEQIFFINEAWEGTLIGEDIYVNMRPRVIQYNRLSNPSRCHFGIIGSTYNMNDDKPFSLVDMMKPYNYLYNAAHDRLNKAMAANWGKLIQLDLSKVPRDWDIDKWMYYAKVNHVAVIDSFKEGNYGSSTGKLAGALNNASTGAIDAETGNYIQQQLNLLEYIKMEMAEVGGISKQREGQISNRETVGGVERATLQSSHITEWINAIHDDVKRRVLEAFLETAKIAFKGRSKKFQYFLSDNSMKLMELDGDEFAECDYGLVVDSSNKTQELDSKLESLAHAALQNQTLSFSAIMKISTSASLAEKQRFIEKDEKAMQERVAQSQQSKQESDERIAQSQLQLKQADLQQKEQANIRDNETKLLIAQMTKDNDNEEEDVVIDEYSQEAKDNLLEKIRQFDEKMKLDKERLKLDKSKAASDEAIKRESLRSKNNAAKSKKD